MRLKRSILHMLAAIATIAVCGDCGHLWRVDAVAEQATGEPKAPAVTQPGQTHGNTDTSKWFRGALAWDTSPVDLRFLNRDDRPAGRHGFVKADGDHFVFDDGTPARFWGG